MPHCPQQHWSDTDDFCSVCGLALEAPVAAAAASAPLPTPTPPATAAGECPVCHAPRGAADSAYCEECGCHFELAAQGLASAALVPVEPPASAAREPAAVPASEPVATLRWDVEARALGDDAPAELRAVARVFPLDLPDQLVGRHSARRGIQPEIALDDDDGISHRHARLRVHADGVELIDLGSANGTLRNGTPVPAQIPLALHDGDRLQLGRWTELLLRQR
ncbi:MAG: FHA domain-containing protein [Verrucomicrobia bacterium]|nr:FHA domain-containing protein [Verrucomicrobiota bacterium]